MEEYEDIITLAISQLTEKAMREQRVADEKVSAMTGELIDLSQEVADAPLNPDLRSKLDRYLNLTHLLEGFREEHLYVQGAKDCVRLLKELGVLA